MNFEIPSVNQKQGFVSFVRSRLSTLFLPDGQVTDPDCVDDNMDVRSSTRCELRSQTEVFSNLMEAAHQIVNHDARGLPSLVTAILRPLQSEQILSVAERPQHGAREAIRFDQLFSSDYFFSYFDSDDCIRRTAGDFRIDLARDSVLTTPWRRADFASALANIGDGKKSGSWRQDPNHAIMLVLPWRIAIVTGGNHSIASGILGHVGSVVPTDVLDLSPIFDKVVCDGTQFLSKSTGKAVARARDGRMAALFEVGRLMAQASILRPDTAVAELKPDSSSLGLQ